MLLQIVIGELVFLRNARHSWSISHNGYLFSCNIGVCSAERSQWRCCRKRSGCRAKLTTLNFTLPRHPGR